MSNLDRSPSARASLEGDDVVFMYPAADPAVYGEYGCTFLAWGGAATGAAVRQLAAMGVRPTGSMWCLTAGAARLHADADLRDAVVRDVAGNPVRVWWLFDHVHEGTPAWFGCTNHPAFRAHVRQRVAEEMRGGASGLHVDDHLGTAHAVAFLGGCFCDHCMAAFGDWLARHGTPAMLAEAGVADWAGFDYRALVRTVAADDPAYRAAGDRVPLRAAFLDCQLQRAAENVRQLGALAAEIAGRPVTLSANTALPELPHLTVTPHLTHLVGEVPHQAERGTDGLHEAVHAYRMAEAIGKPLAATARGQDWAFIRARGATNLVKTWIALGHASGHRLMAPHRQWCFTTELGSHWYAGPAAAYAPLYQFVRRHPDLFRRTTTLGPTAPPAGVPRTFDTAADRAAVERLLAASDSLPLQVGRVWVFPRRAADGSLLVHLLNLDYSADDDTTTPKADLTVTLPDYGAAAASAATVYAYDAEAVAAGQFRSAGTVTLTVPELRLWAVVALRPLAGGRPG